MRLSIPRTQLQAHPLQILRRAGYAYIRSRKTGQESYVRRLGPNFYPRLHLYVEESGDRVDFNLHLDQKEASYAGAHAHNADYDGPVVTEEIARLKSVISDLAANQPSAGQNPPVSGPRSSKFETKSFWSKLFG